MTFEVWNKDTIRELEMHQKEQWFDVLNNGLVKDRGYDVKDPNIEKIQSDIKQSYFKYLQEATRTPDYMSYFVLYDDKRIVSVCRVVQKATVYYLEGLETHRDEQRKGYASLLVQNVIAYLKELDITTIRSEVAMHNTASIGFHEFLGFVEYDRTDTKIRYQYIIMDKPRYAPYFYIVYIWQLIIGIVYTNDYNNRYYKSMKKLHYLLYALILAIFNGLLYALNIRSLWLIVLNNLVMWCLTSIANVVRRSIATDQSYRHFIKNLIVYNTIVVFIVVIGWILFVI